MKQKSYRQENPVAVTAQPTCAVGVAAAGSIRVAVTKTIPFGEAIPVDVPTLADIAAYQATSTTWANVPYGAASWAEPTLGGTVLYQRVDIAIPSTAAPAGGYPVIVYFHANAASKTVGAGSAIDVNVKQPALAAGYAFVAVEFRHPVTNEAEGAPHTDAGLALQFVRGLHSALNLDTGKFFGLCQSRGTLALWQSVQADMLNAYANTYAGRQSSRLQGVWVIQGQIAYSTQRFAELYVVEGDRAAVVAEHPDNIAWGDAIDDVPAVDVLPQLVMIHEAAYFGAQVSKATLDAMGNEYVHFPDAGRLLRDAYAARSASPRISVYDAEADQTERLADMVPWVKYLLEGLNSAEAFAMARALRRGAQAHYVADDWRGMSQVADGSGTPVLDGPLGAITASQHGPANRLLGVSALGYGAGQSISANRPKLAAIGNGHFGIQFDTTDRLQVGMPSDGTPNWVGWTLTGEVTVLNAQSAGSYTMGPTALDNRTLALSIGSNDAMTTNDMKVYRNFASLWAGVSYP